MEESGKKMNEKMDEEPDKQKDEDIVLENSEKESEKVDNTEKSEPKLSEETQDKEKIHEEPEEMKKLPLSRTRWEDVVFSFPQPRIEFGKGVVKNVPKAIFNLLDPMLIHIKKAEIE